MKTKLDHITNGVVLVTCLAVLGTIGVQIWKGTFVPKLQQRPTVENVESQNIKVAASGAPVQGSENAALAIIEYSDFQCPYCGFYTRNTFPKIKKEFVETGKIKYMFRNLPLAIHDMAEGAANAGRCAQAQGQFWQMHDLLFANQQALTHGDLLDTANALRLETAAFESCLSSIGKDRLTKDRDEAAKLGITSTPSFLVGTMAQNGEVRVLRKILGAQPVTTFEAVVKELLAATPEQGARLGLR